MPPLEPGPARPWQADVKVSTYSRVNTRHGNLFTEIPIVSWSGRGPDIDFRLYHNSANWLQTSADTANVGFFLGPGWSISYSDHLKWVTSGLQMIRADGTRDTFASSGGLFTAPSGVYDVLTQVAGSNPVRYRLTHKDQSYHEFLTYSDGQIRLEKVVDAFGNSIDLAYSTTTPKRLISITSGAGGSVGTQARPLEFQYVGDKLDKIKDVWDEGNQADRYWKFFYTAEYNGGEWMTAVDDAMDYRIEFEYEAAPCDSGGGESMSASFGEPGWSEGQTDEPGDYDSIVDLPVETEPLSSQSSMLLLPGECPSNDFVGRLMRVSDKFDPDIPGVSDPYTIADNYRYTYYSPPTVAANKLAYVYDPDAHPGAVGYQPLNQHVTYAILANGRATTTFWDRRGSQWKYGYNDANQNIYPDGNLNWMLDPTNVGYSFIWINRNLTDVYDNNLNYWFYYYDSRGNVTSAENGLGSMGSWAYDSKNNLTSHTDPLGNVTRLCYIDSTIAPYPTMLSKIIEPRETTTPTSPPDCNATGYPTSQVEFYTSGNGNGELKQITDPNGVVTSITYDAWGQLDVYTEGLLNAQTASPSPVYQLNLGVDSGGNTTSSSSSGGGSGQTGYNANGNPDALKCVLGAVTPADPPALPTHFPARPCQAISLPSIAVTAPTISYTPKGELISLPLGVQGQSRTQNYEYDPLGRIFERNVQSNEYGNVTRYYTYWLNRTIGQLEREGPDGLETVVLFDTANRVEYASRGLPNDFPVIDATYDYNNLGLLVSITYGTNNYTSYTYDEAYRVTQIRHAKTSADMLRLVYTYTADNLPETITENGASGSMAAVTAFTYDHRRRLIREVRQTYDGTPSYDLTYQYDAGGNRIRKIDAVNQTETRYHYDVDGDASYGSFNNRLEWYEVYSTIGAMQRLSRTWYFYQYAADGTSSGNVERIVTKPDASTQYTSTFFKYAHNTQIVTFVVGEQWEWNGTDTCVPNSTYQRTYAWGFLYDGARQRYATRALDPTQLSEQNPVYYDEGTIWTDYDGDELYGDYKITVAGTQTTTREQTAYQPGLGRFSWSPTGNPALPVSNTETYYHGDHLGTLRGTSNYQGSWQVPMAFTTFGERITGTQNTYMTRIGYVGAHGYQSTPNFETTPDTDIGVLHVGHRYYDPATGRFLQRDPIGIAGGFNVYQYVLASPAANIDPSGTGPMGKLVGGTIGAGVGTIVGGLVCAVITKNPIAIGGAMGSAGYAGGEVGETIGDLLGDLLSGDGGPFSSGPYSDDTSLDITVTLPPPIVPITPPGPIIRPNPNPRQ